MIPIEKKYILNEKKEMVAVQMDIETFDKIESLLEDHALGRYLQSELDEERLSVAEAKAVYKSLPKD